MRDSDKVIPLNIDNDASPKAIEGGAVPLMQNARVLDTTNNHKYVITSVQGNLKLPFTIDNSSICIGKKESLADDSVYYFLKGNNIDYVLWYKDGVIQTVMEFPSSTFWEDSIHSIDFNSPYLLWTQKDRPQRMLDVVRANRTGKKLEMYIYFGVPDTGNVVFANGQEYFFSAETSAGVPIFTNELILTCDGTYEDDIPTGIQNFVDAFNASVANTDYVAEGCSEGRVKITELVASGTANYDISTMEVTTTGGSPVLLSYPNIYFDYDPSYIELAHYAPSVQPTATYKTDSTVITNYVNQSVWQFCYRYKYYDNTHSTPSPTSNIPIPNYNATSDSVDNYIDIEFTDPNLTGLEINLIEYVELYVKEYNEGQWQLIEQLPFSQIGTDRQFYKWYNNNLTIAAAQTELLKPYESIPFESETLVIASESSSEGSRLFLGNNTEGYDLICGDFNINNNVVEIPNIPSKTGEVIVNIQIKGATGSTEFLYWNGTDVVWGGAGGVGMTWVAGVGTEYGQVCPQNGFTVYLAGTEYRCTTKQVISATNISVLPFYDLENGILDASTPAKKAAIEGATAFIASQRGIIQNVRSGSYIVRVASHWCSESGEYKGGAYKIDESLKFQTTSTYIADGDLDDFDGAGIAIPPTPREYLIELDYDSATPIPSPSGIIFTLMDLTEPEDLYAARALDGYAYRGENNAPINSLRVSNAKGTLGYSTYRWAIRSRTDHNGFLFASFSKLIGSATESYQIDNVFTDGDTAYEIDANCFYENIFSANPITDLFDTEKTTHVIFPDYEQDYAPQTKTLTIQSGYLVPLKGLLVARTRVGVWANTDDLGQISLTFISDNLVGDMDFSLGQIGVADVNFEEYTDGTGTYPNTFPVPDSTTLFKCNPTLSMPFSTWKNGGNWDFRIVYFDNQNRIVGATENFVAQSTDLLIDDTDYQALSFSINNLPPEGATYYQFVRSLNPQFYLQFVMDKPKYYAIWINDLDNTETSFEAGNAKEIWISKRAITEFNKNLDTTLGYEWEAGDRLQLIRNIQDNTIITPSYFDLKITKQVGDYIVIQNDYNLPKLEAGWLIQVYRELKTSEYESMCQFMESHPIVNGFHTRGNSASFLTAQDQTSSQPATGVFIYGDTWRYQRTMKTTIDEFQIWVYNIESPSMSDFWTSDDQNIGRTYTFDKNIKRVNYNSLVRFSNIYKPSTNINGYANFESESKKNLPPYVGGIAKLEWTGDVILALCQIRVVSMYVGVSTIKDNTGSYVMALSDSVLPNYNDLKAPEGRTSGCRHPLSVVNTGGGQVYWYDALSGSVIQYSGNALFPCSDNGLSSEFSKYKKYPSNAIRGVFDRRFGEVVMVTSYGEAQNTWAFNVKNNVWVSSYSFYPELMASVSQRLISWIDGELWEHERGLQMNFYGTQFEFLISFVFNKGNSYQKLYLNMDVEAEFSSPDADTFYVPLIISSQSDIKVQNSELIESDFEVRENAYKAAFLRDSLSGGTDPLIEGDMLKGYWMKVDLTHKNQYPMYLYAATVYFNVANPTNQ